MIRAYDLWRDNDTDRIASVLYADEARVVYRYEPDAAFMLGPRRFLRDFTRVALERTQSEGRE
jgi:hypothetical protein